MVDVQLLNDALTTIAIACGAAIFLALSIVAIAAARQRRARAGRIQAAAGRLAMPTGSSREEALREPALR
jgi:hypothetical protein